MIDELWIQAAVAKLRRDGTDSQTVEAKSAAGGVPSSLASTLSAFANLPGGGDLILGLDERQNFAAVPINTQALAKAVASIARQSLIPSVSVEMSEVEFEGHELLVVRVLEIPVSAKPCVVKRTRLGYLRSSDGDYELSELEIQGFLTNRTQPRFDTSPVPDARRSDLSSDLLSSYLATARATDRGLARVQNDEQLLLKTGVLADADTPTLAGLLALGEYPQQWFPNFVIQGSVSPTAGQTPTVRVGDVARFSGPIPQMIDDALIWITGHSKHRIIDSPDGRVRDQYDFPPVAVRELLGNALVHRDLAEWSWASAIELRIDDAELRLTNPGGLYGLTVSRLFSNQLASARNLSLTRICQYVTLRDGRVIEALATGMTKILQSTQGDGLPTPRFYDNAITFTAILERPVAQPPIPTRATPARRQPSPAELAVLAALGVSSKTAAALAAAAGISLAAVQRHLRSLRTNGQVTMQGGPGLPTIYRRADS